MLHYLRETLWSLSFLLHMYCVLAADLLTDSAALAVVVIYAYALSFLPDYAIRAVQVAEEAAVAFFSVTYWFFCPESAVNTNQCVLVGRSKWYIFEGGKLLCIYVTEHLDNLLISLFNCLKV